MMLSLNQEANKIVKTLVKVLLIPIHTLTMKVRIVLDIVIYGNAYILLILSIYNNIILNPDRRNECINFMICFFLYVFIHDL